MSNPVSPTSPTKLPRPRRPSGTPRSHPASPNSKGGTPNSLSPNSSTSTISPSSANVPAMTAMLLTMKEATKSKNRAQEFNGLPPDTLDASFTKQSPLDSPRTPRSSTADVNNSKSTPYSPTTPETSVYHTPPTSIAPPKPLIVPDSARSSRSSRLSAAMFSPERDIIDLDNLSDEDDLLPAEDNSRSRSPGAWLYSPAPKSGQASLDTSEPTRSLPSSIIPPGPLKALPLLSTSPPSLPPSNSALKPSSPPPPPPPPPEPVKDIEQSQVNSATPVKAETSHEVDATTTSPVVPSKPPVEVVGPVERQPLSSAAPSKPPPEPTKPEPTAVPKLALGSLAAAAPAAGVKTSPGRSAGRRDSSSSSPRPSGIPLPSPRRGASSTPSSRIPTPRRGSTSSTAPLTSAALASAEAAFAAREASISARERAVIVKEASFGRRKSVGTIGNGDGGSDASAKREVLEAKIALHQARWIAMTIAAPVLFSLDGEDVPRPGWTWVSDHHDTIHGVSGTLDSYEPLIGFPVNLSSISSVTVPSEDEVPDLPPTPPGSDTNPLVPPKSLRPIHGVKLTLAEVDLENIIWFRSKEVASLWLAGLQAGLEH